MKIIAGRRSGKSFMQFETICKFVEEKQAALEQAVEDIRMLGRTGEFICPVCAHYNHGEGTSGECVKCLTGDGFRWRGEKMDETSP